MYLSNNISRQLIKTGGISLKYNESNFFKKYEIGYWELFQDINNETNNPVSGPYQVFRPVYKFKTHDKALRKMQKISNI